MIDGPVWHPFTQHATEPPLPRAIRTEGAYIDTDRGRLIDAIASWWVVTHGHRQPQIMQAIRDATEHLDQVIFANITHEPAEELARALVAMAPPGLSRVFYSDSGSTCVEVALKMALGYWQAQGQPRHRIVVMDHSYHGDTIGTMSVGARGVFNAPYEKLMFSVDSIPVPGPETGTLNAFRILAERGDVAALIVEPLILGSGGMLMYGPEILAGFRKICDETGVLLIADEVMTGWGRTGRMWACDHAGISPDILCTSKGLTGGAIPLAATLATDAVFRAHWSEDRSRMFFHSSSYTANPIACAAAVANTKLWQAEPMQARLDRLGQAQADRLAALSGDARWENPRRVGTIAAIDLKVGAAGYLAAEGPRMRAFFMERGVLLRPLGNTVYVMPPYCASDDDLDQIWQAIADYRPA